MLPSSKFALSLKPNVAYLVLNFAPDWKKHTTLSSLAYAGIPYQSLGVRPGALSLMIVWRRLAMVRSGSRISAIFASTTLSPFPLPAFSWTRSLIAPRSSSVNALPVEVVLLADFCVPFCAGFMEFDSSFQSLSIFSRVHFLRFDQLRRLERHAGFHIFCSVVVSSCSEKNWKFHGQFVSEREQSRTT